MFGHDAGVSRAGHETSVLLTRGGDDDEPEQQQLSFPSANAGSSHSVAGAADDRTAAVQLPAAGRHAAARAFLTGTYVDKGYRHTAPLYGPPTVHDRAYQLMAAILVGFSALLVGGMAAVAGWWEVNIATTNTSSTAANNEELMVTFGKTENFRVLCAVVAFCGPCAILSFLNAFVNFLHLEHSLAGMRTMPDEEIIARYLDSYTHPRFRAMMLLMAAWVTVPLLLPISGVGLAYQTFVVMYSGPIVMMGLLNGPVVKYSPMALGAALRHVQTRLAMRKYYTRVIVLVLRCWLFSTVLLVVGVERTILVGEYRELGTSIVTGGKHCELSLLAMPAELTVGMVFFSMAEASGLSMRNAVGQLQVTARHLCVLLMVALTVIPHLVNVGALVNGIDGPDGAKFCQALAWGCVGPLVLLNCGFSLLAFGLALQCIDQYLDLRCLRVLASPVVRVWYRAQQELTEGGERTTRWSVQGRYAAFVSHYKAEAATEARHLKDKLTTMLSSPVFLDSDDLADLRNLLDAVAQSDVLVLLQTTNLLTRPWCLLEIYTALRNDVPIVTVAVKGAFVYSFEDALEMLGTADDDSSNYSFADELNKRNAGAATVIQEQRIPVCGKLEHVDIGEMGKALREHVPQIISKDYSPAASFRSIEAQLEDIVETMAAVVQAGRD
jgi:hypothetical protein